MDNNIIIGFAEGEFFMNVNDALWHIFETTGSVEAYLDYSKAEKKHEDKEEIGFGSGGNGGNNNKKG